MTFGKAWGHDGQSYNGKDMRALAASLLYASSVGGITAAGEMAVSAQTSPNATVRVAAGKALIPATGAGLGFVYHAWNDGFVNSGSFTATGAQARTDRVILRVDASGNVNVQIVAGTPGPGVPAPPTVTGDNFLVLARVEIPLSTSTITNGMIIQEARVIPQAASRVESTLLAFMSPVGGDLNWEPDTGRIGLWTGTAWVYISEPETAYTPNVTAADAAFSLGNGTIVGRKARKNHKLCRVQIELTSGSTTDGGRGNISFSLPHAPRIGAPGQELHAKCFVPGAGTYIGAAAILSDGRLYPYFPVSATQSDVTIYRNVLASGVPGTGVPAVAGGFTLANGAACIVDGEYEMA